MHKIFGMPFATVYPLYVTKLERKGHTRAELDEVIKWLTGFDAATLGKHVEAGTTFENFFADATLMQKIRYLDKLVDELARGKAMEKVLRG